MLGRLRSSAHEGLCVRMIACMDLIPGGDGGAAVEGWLHCER